MKKVLFLMMIVCTAFGLSSCSDSESSEHDATVAQELSGTFNDDATIVHDFWLEGNTDEHQGNGAVTIKANEENQVSLTGYITANGQVVDNRLVLDPNHRKLGNVVYDETFSVVDLLDLNKFELTQTIIGTSHEDKSQDPKPFKTVVTHRLNRME